MDTVRFANALDGFAFDLATPTSAPSSRSPLWVTRDGGGRWRRSGVHGVLAFALGGGFAYVLTGRCEGGTCQDLWLHRSAVGSRHWRSLRLPFASVEPAASMTVAGAAVWISVVASSSSSSRLWLSTDRGSHFVARSAPCTRARAVTVTASSRRVLWAVCAGPATSLRLSQDGGSAWADVSVPDPLTPSALLAPTGGTGAVLATGTGARLLRTTDAGSSFLDVTPAHAHGRWAALSFTGAQVGGGLLVTASTTGAARRVQLWRSTDAGVKWTGPVGVAPASSARS